jgi:serine/arginine repetitive matrix protein 2
VSPTSAIEQSLADVRETDLEVVEFTDMAKFVGVPDEPAAEEATEVSRVLGSRPPRPTAADFLDSQPDSSKSEAPASWRSSRAVSSTEAQKDIEMAPVVESLPPTVAPAPKSPYKQAFRKEAPMTTLDDVMSRIKGALDVMQNAEKEAVVAEVEVSAPKPALPPKDRWIPPALRERHVPDPENFSITTVPFLLESANSKVRLPKVSPPPLPIHHRQLVMFHKWHPPRPDVLSYDPVAQGMHKKEATLSEMLHRKPLFKGSKFRYKVLLPRISYRIPTGPRVNLPPRTPGAFGKPTPAEEASTWRKPRSSDGVDPSSGSLDVPAEAEAKADEKESSVSIPQRRVQPKMPAGSSVAFYRDSKIVEVESDAMPLVSFIVTSELDENKQTSEDLVSKSPLSSKISQQSSPVAPSGVTSKTSPLPLVNGIMPPGMSTSEFGLPALSPSKSEGRSTTDTVRVSYFLECF